MVGILLIYWQVRNIDPEGSCKGFEYFSKCWDAWANYHQALNFKKLPADQKMIDSFNQHRQDFDDAKDQAMSQTNYAGFLNKPAWKARHGIDYFYNMIPWPPSVYSSSRTVEPASNHEWAWRFYVESTMYIAGAGKEWPWVNRLKGYLYFPLPEPRIEQGKLLGAMQFADGQRRPWRVLEQLDGDWPEDWASGECLLRRIEPQWFLILCKDHVGG
ncbi:hypothetical protein [Methylovulum miyakonense]|uniref:hypothetical protein n=1 Tax=Methylovulum miyakonense TaxID=645578 RepID=UPI0003828F31|nr:hypothetical protein [Methylovulum miyakonense]